MGKGSGKFFKFSLIIGGIVLLTIAVIILILAIQSATLDQRIAHFEAKRKIPDSENAAVIYESIFTDVNFATISQDDLFIQMTTSKDFNKPWKSEAHPETAEWIKNRRDMIDKLLTASKFENCCFPLPVNGNRTPILHRMAYFRNIALFLTIASHNDIAEGRFDKAMEKNYILLRMGGHIIQQPYMVGYLIATSIQAIPLSNLKKYTMDPNITEEQLKTIENFPILIKQEWNKQLTPQLIEGDEIIADKFRESMPFFQRIKRFFLEYSDNKHNYERARKFYFGFLSLGYGDKILIGLRRFENQNGKWPENLEQIKSLVDPNVLVDPQNNSSFVYKLTDNGFALYSKGPNNIDEGGNRTEPADDWPIWPEKR